MSLYEIMYRVYELRFCKQYFVKVKHYVVPMAIVEDQTLDYVEGLTWYVAYKIYAHPEKTFKGEREWHGIRDGTVIFEWSFLEGPFTSVCYEYREDIIAQQIEDKILEDVRLGFTLSAVEVAGKLPRSVKQVLKRLEEQGIIRVEKTELPTEYW
jgi:hypothetical protein